MDISEAVRMVRKERGISQSKLSERSGVPQTSISDIEHARYSPRLDQVSRIARAFGMEVGDLLQRVPEIKEAK